jgi:malate synthase
MTGANQLSMTRHDVAVGARDLLTVPEGPITEAGLRTNVDVGIQYLEAWLRGTGCVPIYDLMEDAATAEISRTQVWQWLHHGARLDDGRVVTPELVRQVSADETDRLRKSLGPDRFDTGRFPLAARLFDELMTGTEFADFLTLRAYDHID